MWFYNPQWKKGLNPKLMNPWQGPYSVVKKINNLVYGIGTSINQEWFTGTDYGDIVAAMCPLGLT